MKKRLISLCLLVVLSFSITGCSNKGVVTKAMGHINYKFDEDLETIKVDDSVKDYYESFKWDRAAAFKNLSETTTYVDDDNSKYVLTSSVDDDGNVKTLMSSEDDNKDTFSCESRIVGDKSYLKVSSSLMEKPAYFMSDYDPQSSSLATSQYCEVFSLAKSIASIDKDNKDTKITFNARTKLNDTLADNITISFYGNASYTYVLFVDANTHKVLRISSTLISSNDYTDLTYADNGNWKISGFSDDEMKDSAQGQVNKVDDSTISSLFNTVTYSVYNRNTDDLSKSKDNTENTEENTEKNTENTEKNTEESEVK